MFATFIAAKFIFFLNNGFPSFGDTLDVLLHGLPLDLNIAAYTSAPLWLGALTLLWINNEVGCAFCAAPTAFTPPFSAYWSS